MFARCSQGEGRGVPAVVIRGLGLVTPLAAGAWTNHRLLLAGASVADRLPALPEDIAKIDLVRSVGSSGLATLASDPAVELAERAVREAMAEAGGSPAGMPCFAGTSKGAVTAWLDWVRRWTARDPADPVADGDPQAPNGLGSPALVGCLGPGGFFNAELMRRCGVRVDRHLVGACASSLQALGEASAWLARGSIEADRVASDAPRRAVVVTAESALLPMLIASYERLGVLAGRGRDDYVERPLDRRRRGFVLTELSAAVVLEAVEQPGPGDIELVAVAQGGEAYDLVRPDPTMPALRDLAGGLFSHGVPTVIHPHAPGTVDHDPAELAALSEALGGAGGGGDPSMLYACKGAVGHGLGSAGLVSVVIAAMSLRSGQLPPMPWLAKPIAEASGRLKVRPQGRSIPRQGVHAVFAAGFGGHTAGALIRGH